MLEQLLFAMLLTDNPMQLTRNMHFMKSLFVRAKHHEIFFVILKVIHQLWKVNTSGVRNANVFLCDDVSCEDTNRSSQQNNRTSHVIRHFPFGIHNQLWQTICLVCFRDSTLFSQRTIKETGVFIIDLVCSQAQNVLSKIPSMQLLLPEKPTDVLQCNNYN